MKRLWSLFACLVSFFPILAGCQVIGDIFKAGVWVGAILVILVIGGIAWLFMRASS
jgi:hypothetical protein